ncbi:MAG: aminodeoxychorismate synthase component I [Desulfobacteraceae bacterium]|nr:aminodeoxychorismate synthase component I [Desulfobacteraceae bacterium]
MQDKPDLRNLVEPFDFVHTEEIKPEGSFIETAACFADIPGTVVLASGGNLDCARYHILAACPWLTFKAWPGSAIIEAGGSRINYQGNTLDALGLVINRYCTRDPDLPEPVAAGLFGYLAYDLKDEIEKLPRTAVDDTRLPVVCMYAPMIVMVCDILENRTMLCIPVWKATGEEGLERQRRWFFETVAGKGGSGRDFAGGAGGFYSPFTSKTYMEAVERIRQYIAAGHIYQVNLSQRFETGFSGSPYAMFAELFSRAPASFYSYVNAGDHWIVSTSPERFLMRRGDFVETRPIKGTRPRGYDPETDRATAEELKNSPKDDAELSMIVDLMRNDLGRVCAGGSVEVFEHRRLEAYQNVFHLVSVVRGRLAPQNDSVDLIRAAFPGGSITGCPRIRAMEIIDEIEPCRRHVYTGSIGYISFHDTMDFSIAIRTALIFNNRMLFSVGGGVVFDSDPKAEYEETLHKGRSVMSVFEGRKGAPAKQSRIWMNGMLVPESEASLPVSCTGFQYGYGFFETIRVERGNPHLLNEHLGRFTGSWRELFDLPAPDLSWDEIIRQVVGANDLEKQVCAVKLLAAAGDTRNHGTGPHIVVTAAPYVHRLEQAGKPALDLAVYPHPRHTPLASHKSLNYLYYYLAGRQAKEKGADEAVILNPDRTVSETNTANLLLVSGNIVIQPKSRHVLAGVMQAAVLKRLEEKGYETKRISVPLESFFEVDTVIVTNSLMGPVGARSVDGREIACDTEWIAGLRSEVLS